MELVVCFRPAAAKPTASDKGTQARHCGGGNWRQIFQVEASVRRKDNTAALSSPAFDQRAARTLKGRALVPRLLTITTFLESMVRGSQFFTAFTVFCYRHDEVVAESPSKQESTRGECWIRMGAECSSFVEGST